MSRVCQLTKKGPQRGCNVSHAHNKTKKTWKVNLQKRRLFDPKSGKWVSLRISTRTLRAIDKKGLAAVLSEAGVSINDLR